MPPPNGQRRRARTSLLLLAPLCLFLSPAAGQGANEILVYRARGPDQMPAFAPIRDPLEPLNRCLFLVNHGLMLAVISPVGNVYRFVIPEAARDCVRRAGVNLAYPTRCIGSLLQGRGGGAWRETRRFGINTTVGLLGLFDPAGKRYGIQPSDEDFGQALAAWGWRRSSYLMLPLLGPSTARDTLGLVPDTATNLTTYAGSTLFRFNELTYLIRPYWRLRQAKEDPYAWTRDLWAIWRKARIADSGREFSTDQPGEPKGARQTLQSVFLAPRDEEFLYESLFGKVRLPDTGRKFRYNCWLHPSPAPIVYIIPGYGGHRTGHSAVALAEMAFNHGLSAVAVSNSMNPEFVENASTVAVPGFLPFDAHDAHVALSAVHRQLRRRHPEAVGERTRTALLGVSLGGIQTLFMAAAHSDADPGLIRFDGYAAVHAPIDLAHGMRALDAFHDAPIQAWTDPTERARRLNHLVMKVIDVTQTAVEPDRALEPHAELPFTETEAKHLIGLVFRLGLRDAVYVSHKRRGKSVSGGRLPRFKRRHAYATLMDSSFDDYAKDLILRMLNRTDRASFARSCHGFVLSAMDRDAEEPWDFAALERACNLKTYEERIRDNSAAVLFLNRNDFLLVSGDLQWVGDVFGTDRHHVFPEGGHLGNLHVPTVQNRIMAEVLRLTARDD